jgi:hypothetical protein
MKLFRSVRRFDGGTIAYSETDGEILVSIWTAETDELQIVERFPYEGVADRRAALAMARGFIATY